VIPVAVDELGRLGLGELEGDGDGDGELTGVHIDSRRVGRGDLFVAVGGGAAFLDDARAAGAAATHVADDAFSALAAIASLVRERSDARVVAITGSTGKTSTKDILAALCAPIARTVASEGNYNNELGVPLTVCRLEADTEVLITELGMRGFGQIAELCAFVRPHVGVVTEVGPAHLELVGSVDGVARAKAELLEALPPGAPAILPAQAPELDAYIPTGLEIHRTPALAEVEVEIGLEISTLRFAGRAVQLPLTARHQLQNALTALTTYAALGLPLDRVEEGAEIVRVSHWRGEELELPSGGVVVNDAYNANPTSIRAALLDLRERAGEGRAVAVLGGMAELGEHAGRYHREAAELADELGVEVIAVGELARGYGAERWVPDADAALAALVDVVRPGDVVLVKGSRSVGLEGIAPALANPQRAWSAS